MENGKAVLRSENLVKIYGKRRVVNNVSVEIQQGEIVGLLGPNGAGKTTTFYQITGMIKPTDGRFFLETGILQNILCTSGHAWVLGTFHRNLQYSEN